MTLRTTGDMSTTSIKWAKKKKRQELGQSWVITTVYGPWLHLEAVVVKLTALDEAVHEQ